MQGPGIMCGDRYHEGHICVEHEMAIVFLIYCYSWLW